ncbi:tungstate transport system ATP-binding protein [Cribrihabitans marinus]|uniref:Tungstate transport system ATP-binding protein n=1 Tax=Cribrihabitans marinus TaxID=1227549 RepID=A0A1H7D1D6_9RHOB|nr:ATP-binding cassette domain-containing protein [Cribrihabitans marinus]GGH37449.1 ABC transporter ATP-binding protein [Cribrihabitans marinus]SEJ95718.1 tungstate transport system ATP-binding protein [Cribrihabitans marinus]
MPDTLLPVMPPADPPAPARSALMPLRVRDLTLQMRGQPLLDIPALDLDCAGTTVIMGANGAGKSLLLRLLHGLIAPSSGTIAWGGAAMSPAIARRQALVFQKPVLLRRSVAANLDFVLRARRAGTAEARDALLARVGLTHKASQPARLLSGGEQQRLALARALATRPDILFLDEPTASLDPAAVQSFEGIVSDIADEGTSVIFVTHDVGQARRMAREVVFLHQGRITEHSAAPRFFAAPQSRAARAYLAGQLPL